MANESCTHPEGKPGKHCPDCGENVADPSESVLETVMERVLRKHKLIKDEPAGAGPKTETLLDKLTGPRKKEKK